MRQPLVLGLTSLATIGLLAASCGSRAPASGPAPASANPGAAASTTAASTPVATGPCGHGSVPPASYSHVVWIWMENHSSEQVLGSPQAPYETALARQCGTASHYSSVGSPSLPNYLAATSGTTWGISDDGPPSAHALPVNNLFGQVRAAGGVARSYEEDMARPCQLTSAGKYAVKHNPAAYYTGASDRTACQVDDLPLGDLGSGPLADVTSMGALPTFTFITPNLCNDTHDCPVAVGDAWLARWVPKILSSPAYKSASTVVFVVWDEDSPMPNIVISPSTPSGTVASGRFNHYSLLRTAEELLGLPLIGSANAAASMRQPFGL